MVIHRNTSDKLNLFVFSWSKKAFWFKTTPSRVGRNAGYKKSEGRRSQEFGAGKLNVVGVIIFKFKLN